MVLLTLPRVASIDSMRVRCRSGFISGGLSLRKPERGSGMKAVLIDQSKVGLGLFVDSARCQTAQRRGVSACGVSCSASEQVVGLGMALHVWFRSRTSASTPLISWAAKSLPRCSGLVSTWGIVTTSSRSKKSASATTDPSSSNSYRLLPGRRWTVRRSCSSKGTGKVWQADWAGSSASVFSMNENDAIVKVRSR
jgi:hypothetical protein